MTTDQPEPNLDGSGLALAVVVSRFNQHVTSRLLAGARQALDDCRVSHHDIFFVPGSFELPLAAQRLAQSGRYHAVVCLGAVIRHETDHYEHVAREAAAGIQRAALDSGIPCIFGVLTTDTEQQALDRAGGRRGNRGLEAVQSAVQVANLLRELPQE
ncbi:MAG TPA: 6,7-dimethyl-8-ribityllumazine synthase [Dehalococcoidia bacterium]|nr:6,7-dimethyl-8-ribityllumazine synthase [Dehalococcoidia bacterium]